MTRRLGLGLALLAGHVNAQEVSARNWTATAPAGVQMAISVGGGSSGSNVVNIVGLTNENPSITTISGPAILADPTNEYSVGRQNIAFVSCDIADYPGNINAADVLLSAEGNSASAIVLYTTRADYCELTPGGAYSYVYTLKSSTEAQTVVGDLQNATQSAQAWVTIRSNVAMDNGNGTSPTGNSGPGNNGQNISNHLGPNPSTAVAMIILYSITGIITGLFLVIILTGAVRAHRHPDRYGPRNIIGRPRQSRARGLAMAMLETIPIVKFGEREPPKPTDAHDVELGSITNTETEAQHAATGTENVARASTDGGITAAANLVSTSTTRPALEQQGCSICTDDFEVGQDQRVLPCGHSFHPACVDPWLLNVSGTCPLCRTDLRPQTSHTSADELDEDGYPIRRDDEEVDHLPPPITDLGGNGRSGSSSRGSFLYLGILGIGTPRPDRMTREERILALQRWRLEQAARRQREEETQPSANAETAAASTTAAPGDATRPRRGLRSIFGARTRRSEQQTSPNTDTPAAVNEQPPT